MKTYPVYAFEIWSYHPTLIRDSEAKSNPQCLGISRGRNFHDACIRFFLLKECKRRINFDEKDTYFDTASLCYDIAQNELWGNSLFASKQTALVALVPS